MQVVTVYSSVFPQRQLTDIILYCISYFFASLIKCIQSIVVINLPSMHMTFLLHILEVLGWKLVPRRDLYIV